MRWAPTDPVGPHRPDKAPSALPTSHFLLPTSYFLLVAGGRTRPSLGCARTSCTAARRTWRRCPKAYRVSLPHLPTYVPTYFPTCLLAPVWQRCRTTFFFVRRRRHHHLISISSPHQYLTNDLVPSHLLRSQTAAVSVIHSLMNCVRRRLECLRRACYMMMNDDEW